MRQKALALVILASALACSSSRSSSDPFATASRGGDRLTLQVINRNFYDAQVWAVSGARRVPVGIVAAGSNRNTTFDWRGGSQELRAEIDLQGSGRFVTSPVTALPGDRITLVIESRLRNSYLRR